MFFNGKYSVLKKMKYVADQKGIIDRYIKESSGWANHLENTKKAIIEGAEGKQKKTCAILGSGWLLDIPIEYLSKNFDKVYLFDVLHPTQIKHKMHKISNVELIEQDITGGAIQAFFDAVQTYKSLKKRKEPNEINISGFSYPVDFDYIVSVNILNQLDNLIIDYISSYSLYSEDELKDFRIRIQDQHIKSLPAGKTCLISDYEELLYDKNNQLEEKFPLIYIPFPKSTSSKNWQWNFDHEDYKTDKNVIFNVIALHY